MQGMKNHRAAFRMGPARLGAGVMALLAAAIPVGMAEAKEAPTVKNPWDMAELGKAPKTFPAEGIQARGVRALFFEGPAFRGKPTRVFAWLALPKVADGRKVPGIVLVHGGAGTAFARWVRQWTARGYAAIAMDTCGRVPKPGKIEPGRRHRHAGPDGWGGWDQLDGPEKDQWAYHAVADVILAHSLLRSFPQVDRRRVGLLGISWGAYLACLAAPADGRFRFAIPVYGCGYFQEGGSPIYLGQSRAMGRPAYGRWQRLWDPSRLLGACRTPMLWIAGTNDLAFSMASRQRSYRAAKGAKTLCIRVRWTHNYQTPWQAKEIPVFADGLVGRDVQPLPRITRQGRTGRDVWVRFSSKTPIVRARLCTTRDAGVWNGRKWLSRAAEVDAAKGKATATLPDGVRVYYLNLTDERGLVVSGEHEELDPAAEGRR